MNDTRLLNPNVLTVICRLPGAALQIVRGRHRNCRLAAFAAISLMVVAAGAGHAQISTNGTISGTVLDPQGAAVPAAAVTITNEATGAAVDTKTNSDGSFSQVGLQAGKYQVSISASGFQGSLKRTSTSSRWQCFR
jgi:hypothetical protein